MTLENTAPLPRQLVASWARLQARERRLVIVAVSVVVLALLWMLAIAPPLATLKTASGERAMLRAHALHMQELAREAKTLQALSTLNHEEALQALQQATEKHLANGANLTTVGEQVQVVLDGVSANALAQWLAAARVNARAIPIQASLKHMADTDGAALWSGTLTLVLPP